MPSSLTTRAKDIMQSSPVSLRIDTRLHDAARTFNDYRISGAPVLDESGALVGVLSTRDISRRDHPDDGRSADERREYYLTSPLEEDSEWAWEHDSYDLPDGYSPEAEAETVRDYMSTDIVSVAPDASLAKVAESMLTQRVHRVLVVENGELKGLISSTDLVRYVAQTAGE